MEENRRQQNHRRARNKLGQNAGSIANPDGVLWPYPAK